MNKLAINGGTKLIQTDFEIFNNIGHEEIDAVTRVLKTGRLSNFVGDWEPDFYGGEQVQEFEKLWCEHFDVKHAITVNSWTSGLICAVGSLDIEPQDEIIMPPWTMAATASAVLVWNAIPVFCDIDPQTFTIDPKKIEQKINSRTKAIISVDIHGMSADVDAIMSIAKKYNLKVISDSAQAIGATYKGKNVGTITDIGGFSLNRFKHIHTGEGGVIVTDNEILADRMQMLRNHADAVVASRKTNKINNLIGFNFRMGEIEAAIGIEQLKKLDLIVESRQRFAKQLTEGLSGLQGLEIPDVPTDRTHTYYTFPIKINEDILGVSSKKIRDALEAEGVSIGNSYINLHLYPTYQKKIAYGTKGFPWISDSHQSTANYEIGTCPVSEGYNAGGYLTIECCRYKYSELETKLIIEAFYKVWDNLGELGTEA